MKLKIVLAITMLFSLLSCLQSEKKENTSSKLKVDQVKPTLVQFSKVDHYQPKSVELDFSSQVIAQEKKINTRKKSILKFKKGTEIEVPANAFLLNGKPYYGKVNFSVKECYAVEDMLLANLSTTSDGQLLESGGMLEILAKTKSGQALTLDPHKSLRVKMPVKKLKPDMQLFYAQYNQQNDMDWKPTGLMAKYNYGKYVEEIITLDHDSIVFENNCMAYRYDISEGNYKASKRYENLQRFLTDSQKVISNYSIHVQVNKYGRVLCFRNDSLNSRFDNIEMFYVDDRDSLISAKEFTLNGPYSAILFKASLKGCSKTVESIYMLDAKFFKQNKQYITKRNLLDLKLVANRNYTAYYSDAREKEIKKLKEDRIKDRRKKSMHSVLDYVYTVSELGWINCDRFVNSGRPLVTMNIDDDINEGNVAYKLVFKNINSVLNPFYYKFMNVPLGEEVCLVGIKKVGDKLFVSKKYIEVEERIIVKDTEFKPINLEDLKKVFSQI